MTGNRSHGPVRRLAAPDADMTFWRALFRVVMSRGIGSMPPGDRPPPSRHHIGRGVMRNAPSRDAG